MNLFANLNLFENYDTLITVIRMGAAADPEDQHVKVAVRCRPLNEEEAAMNAAEIVTVSPDQGQISLSST